uniref:beta strand repeat-containing protein n=1 Tax=Yeosuana marina TaxID=1565536 RepID=UPI00142200EE
MEKITFLDLLLSGLFFLENFAKKIISVFTTITKKAGGLVVSDTFGWSNLLRLKKGTYQLVFCLALLSSATAFSQLAVPFTPRLPGGSVKVKGDIVLIGNSIITGKSVSLPYNGTTNNNNLEGEYINVASGGDPSIFSSSTADLNINNSCKSILYAGLYWASIYPLEVATNKNQQFVGTPRLNDWNQVKFKLPTGGFIDLVADNNPDPVGEEDDIIFDGYDPVNINNSFKDSPIICYKNVTSLLQGLADADGTYTLANLRATRGWRTGGCAAGWTLVVIYESPTMPSKFISTFDGYAGVQGSTSLEIPVAGFQTLPAPSPVIAKIGVSALEGDWGIKGDSYSFKASTSGSYTFISDGLNPWNNFFNSRLTNEGAWLNNRNPNGTNALGFDIKSVRIPNGGNSVLPNGSTAGDLKLTTSGDGYGAFVTSFAVDIIEPKILLTKIVEDKFGNEIGGANVTLGDELNYVIGFQNIGNDDATKLTIRDVLPINVLFNYPSDLDILPPGVSVKSYDPITREIVFEVEDWVVTEGDPSPEEIRFKVQVVPSCNMLSDACSNSIDNQAYATYEGVFNPNFTISDDPSINSNAGCILTPKATNFLVGVDDCLFTQTETLCGDSVVLTAANGYSSYSWSTDPSGSPVIGTTQSITVNNTGTYYVHNTAVAPCLSINQEITVIPFGNTITNPVAPFADEVVTCPNDGKLLPNIFLCGANAERVIQTGISDTSSIIWEKLDEGSCTAVVNTDCANESSTCTWTQVGTGPDFTANTSGQYRITLNYTGGCFNRYYFNVYQNLLNPTVTTKDIICTTPGEITVGGVPGGYEYSLDNITYQASNVFPITSQNSYTVYIKQVGVTSNPCIFTVPDIQIRERNFTVSTVITQPYCNGDLGSVKIAANDVRPQYSYAIYSGGTLVNSAGPIVEKDYEFKNLNPGIYTIEVTTEDGCFYSGDIEIINPPLLTATASITKPLTCTDGEITINPVGGTPPYNYIINGGSIETDPVIVVTTPGVYNIIVYDANNCLATTSITIDDNPAPVYTISTTDILCYNDNSGDIQFNVTNANGYTLEYSIDNGITYVSNPVFSNLSPGNYQAIIKYTLGASECFTIPENITINQPDEALTASAGVSELAGCGPSGEGKVRITNPQGGTPPYEYSFDNQATWVTTNESYVLPGTYTLYIRDANGCIYAMPSITLDPEPVAPTINVSDPDFNCDGTAGATVTVTNPGSSSFNYNYLLDGVPNPNTADPKTFLDVSDGSHLITVEYILQSVTTYSNLLKEDFGSGSPTTSSGIASAYCFNDQRVNPPYNCGTRSVEDNQYSVASFFWRSDDPSANNTGAWYHFKDHTTNGVDPNGRYLLVNIGSAAGPYGILYSKPISDVIPNQDIKVELYLGNLIRAARSGAKPDFIIQLVDNTGAVIAEQNTGQIQNNEIWNLKSLSLNPGNNTDLTFVIRSGSILYNGNDAVIDDISVYQLPKSCVTQVDFPFIVDSGKAFASSTTGSTNVTCNGSADGTITIAAQNFDPASGFEYSIDNGITWTTQMTSPYTITGLAAGNYDLMVRYETCSFTFSQTITAPAPLGVSVSGTPVTCLGGSTVTAIATGGTTAYSYQLLDTATSALVSNFPSNGILTNVPAGDYTVRVTDANGCTATDTINLVDSAPPTASIAMTSDYCYDPVNGATLEVIASGGVTPYEYSINGGSFGSSNIFSSLTPGSYDIIVRDAYGCTVALPTETIAPQVTVNTTLTKELDCSATPDATITGTITGGYAPFSYAVSTDGGVTYGSLVSTGSPFVYTAASSGNYQFQITDARGCQSVSNVITISPITNPVVTGIATNVSCNGASDGSVQLVGSGGSGGYTYSDDGITFTGTSLFTGLSASGSPYTFYVQDSKNCTSSVSVTITEPTALVASATATDLSCSATNTNQSAEITIAVPTTGTAPYQYSFDGGANFSSANTLTVNDTGIDQTFSYVVRDANGCTTAPQNITIVALDPPTDLTFSSAAVTCIATTTDVTLTATDGVGPLEYETIAPSPTIVAKQASNVFTGLAPGTYVFRVTDANGCYYTESYTVAPVTPITITGLKLSDVLCYGDNTGAIQYTVSGYAGTYTSTLTSGTGALSQTGSTVDLTGLVAGSYTLEVSDDITGCTANTTIVITEPTNPLTFTATSTNVYCTEDNSQITVTPAGGTASYIYAAVVSGASAPVVYDSSNVITVDTNSATDLVWDVYVQDANGCITIDTITITEDPSPTVTTPAVASNQCSVASGFTFTATGASGVPPYEYSINGGGSYQASPTFTVNTPGSYTVTIRDANGCTNTSPTPTVVYVPLDASALLTKDLTCSAPAAASIDVTTSGGNAPYSYRVKIGAGAYGVPTSIVGASFTYTAPAADTYQFEITDANGCTKETNVITTNTIVNPDITNVIETQTISCNGEETAAINITIDNTKGLAPFVINVFNNTTSQNYGTQTSGLSAGDYIIRVTDAKGCIDTFPITISEPLAINTTYHAVPITCGALGVSQGSVIIDGVTGGTAPYDYIVTSSNGYSGSELNNLGTTSTTFDVVDFGLYQILVVDANGCSQLIQDVLVASPPTDLDINVSSPPADCSTGGSALVQIGTTLASSGPFHFAIYTGPGMTYTSPTVAPWQDESSLGSKETIFTNLIPGAAYTFIVFDESTSCYYYEASTIPIPTNSSLDATAITANNVTCTGSADGSVSFDITSVYGVTTDVTYEIFDSLSLVSTGITGSGTVPANGTLNVTNLGSLPPGNYVVVITEDVGATNAGCSVVTPAVNISESANLLSVSASVSKNENCNELGVISATAQDGTAPYTYQLLLTSDPAPTAASAGWAATNTFNAVAANYTVYVKDAYGCIQSDTVNLTKDVEPTIAPIASQCFDGSPINITVVEGTGTAIAPL